MYIPIWSRIPQPREWEWLCIQYALHTQLNIQPIISYIPTNHELHSSPSSQDLGK